MTSRREAFAGGPGSIAESRDAPRQESSEEALIKLRGTVKWFDATRGFGFIVSDEADGDILIHFSVLKEHDRRSLPEGALVECLVVEQERGLQAKKVLSIDLTHAIVPELGRMQGGPVDRIDPSSLLGHIPETHEARAIAEVNAETAKSRRWLLLKNFASFRGCTPAGRATGDKARLLQSGDDRLKARHDVLARSDRQRLQDS